jgi:hypothetical protein
LQQPRIADCAERLGGYPRREAAIAGDVRETLIPAVASLMQCDFEWQAHRPIGFEAGVATE